jgi:RNA polymerase sigma-70 factor (ECF subfamily)
VDPAAIAAARRGDRRAQAVLLRALQDPMYRFCLSLLGNAEDAREATQESAARLLQGLAGFRGQSRLQTWAMGIALNVVREMRRRPDSRADAQRLRLAPAAASVSPLAQAERGEQWAILRQTLTGLPDRQREALVLRFFADLSVQETADVMGCAVGTVKATVHQALRSLRQRLKGQAIH